MRNFAEITLKANEPQMVELTFGGWKNTTYWLYITTDNTKIRLEINSKKKPEESTAESTPSTETGFEEGTLNLRVNLYGNIIIYDTRTPGIGTLTPKDELGMFYTETHIEGIIWNVFSVKEYPDLSHVVVISGTNSSWTYSISDSETTP